VFSVGSAPRLYKEDPSQSEIKLRDPLEMAVEEDSEEIVGRKLGCAKKT
jgi:hypothetical protein